MRLVVQNPKFDKIYLVKQISENKNLKNFHLWGIWDGNNVTVKYSNKESIVYEIEEFSEKEKIVLVERRSEAVIWVGIIYYKEVIDLFFM